MNILINIRTLSIFLGLLNQTKTAVLQIHCSSLSRRRSISPVYENRLIISSSWADRDDQNRRPARMRIGEKAQKKRRRKIQIGAWPTRSKMGCACGASE
ncbi:hypothetical protein LINPERHAP1_LOCUS33668, partial [Linum perenne]